MNFKNSDLDFINMARQVIGYDTTPQASNVELVEFLKTVCEKLGLCVEVQNEVQNGLAQANIIVKPFETQHGCSYFLLQSHLDTPDSGAFPLWKNNNHNPFDAVIDENFIYGLGAAEVKIDFLCKLWALYNSKDHLNPNAPLIPLLVGTFGEESGMQGALKLIRKNKLNARYALISEPSDLQIIHAAKGFVTVEIRVPMGEIDLQMKKDLEESIELSTQTKLFSGLATHSSTPHLGENAALKMFEYLNTLSDDAVILDIESGSRFNTVPSQASVEYLILNDQEKRSNTTLKKLKKIYSLVLEMQKNMSQDLDQEFEPHHSTLSLGVVRLYEDYILIGGSCRIVPSVRQETYEQWVQNLQKSCHEIGAEFHLQDYKKPFRISRKSVLVKAVQNELEKLNLKPICRTMASANEASLFSRVGIECVCIGIGEREGNIHTPQERVSLKQVQTAQEFYQNMIERMCGQ